MLTLNWDKIFTEDELYRMKIESVNEFLKCSDQERVESSVEYAKFINFKKFDSWSYPLFLEIFKEPNSHVIKALLEQEEPFRLFEKVQPNFYIIDFAFKRLYQYQPGGVHDTVLEVIMGILIRNYKSAKEGFSLYPLSMENLNAIGKFLRKDKPQSDHINRYILDILGCISDYLSINKENEVVDRIAAHAVEIRNAFFDNRVQMSSVLPPEILVEGNYEESEYVPRETVPV